MKTVTSLQLRRLVAELASARMDAGKALGDAEHAHRLATRSALLSGNYAGADRTAAAVKEAREAFEQAQVAEGEAAGLLAEALATEKAAAEAAVRDELRGMAGRVSALADEADAAFATYVGKLRAARQAEAEARKLCETGLGQAAYGGAALPEAIGDAVNYLQSLRNWTPADFKPFVGHRAAVGVRRIETAAGI